jgi:hypothetical protein
MKRCASSLGTDVGEPNAAPALPNKTRSAWRIFRGWVGLSGAYMVLGSCPFCGQSGCPVGLLSAGVFGALIAGVLRLLNWRKRT